MSCQPAAVAGRCEEEENKEIVDDAEREGLWGLDLVAGTVVPGAYLLSGSQIRRPEVEFYNIVEEIVDDNDFYELADAADDADREDAEEEEDAREGEDVEMGEDGEEGEEIIYPLFKTARRSSNELADAADDADGEDAEEEGKAAKLDPKRRVDNYWLCPMCSILKNKSKVIIKHMNTHRREFQAGVLGPHQKRIFEQWDSKTDAEKDNNDNYVKFERPVSRSEGTRDMNKKAANVFTSRLLVL